MKIKLKDFKVVIKPAFFVVLMIMIALDMLGQFFILFISVSLHELAHILVARIFGLRVQALTITPVGECATIKDIERLHILKRILISMAGPFVSLCLCLMFYKSFVGKANLVILLFNLLPIYPLDGGRVLQYILGYFFGVLRANRYVSHINYLVAYMLLLLGFINMTLYFFDIWWFVIAVYIIKISKKEYLNMTFMFYKSIIRKNENRVLPVRNIMVNKTMDLKAIIYRMGWDYYTVVYVKGENILIEEEKIVNMIMFKGVNVSISDILLENNA